ncbi:MAG: twin-arginine translocase subunit TatC [Pseudomonadales bacterium]|nr:twin-arginine translocase subunit TatC [Pseudomonadales bacterium]
MNDTSKNPSASDTDHDPKELPLVSHLVELRDRLLRSVAAIFIVFLCLIAWANDIYEFVSAPLTSVLDAAAGEHIIATRPLDPFLAPFKLTFMLALFICIPYVLHQAWAFVSPGLYKNEIRISLPIIVSSVILFYLGVAFSYFIVLGFLFEFFTNIAPSVVTVTPDISANLDFVMSMFLAFGLVFEIPVATVLLVISGVTTPKALAEKRSYVIIGCFLAATVLTPPDPFSQSMLAIPMCLLYEVGIIASRFFYRPDKDNDAAEEKPAA